MTCENMRHFPSDICWTTFIALRLAFYGMNADGASGEEEMQRFFSAASQNRDRTKGGVRDGPGSAAHRFARATRCAASGARDAVPPAKLTLSGNYAPVAGPAYLP